MNTENIFPVLCELLLKSAAILAFAGLASGLWRSASAASRHMVWVLALAALLALPLTKLAAPLWMVELTAKTAQMVLPPGSAPVPSVDSVASKTPVAVPARSKALPPWRTMLVFVWLAGAAAILGYRLVGDQRLRWLRRHSEPLADEQARTLARAVAADCGLANGIEMRRAPACRVPMAWGVWRPMVLLPDAALSWPEQRLAATLRHEFGHVRRRDCLARLLAQVACAVYWMNPLVWMAARRLRVAQEQACDDLVLRSGASASDYANLIVQTVRGLDGHRLSACHAVAMAQPSTLEARVRAIVDERRNRAPLGRGALAVGAAAAVALIAVSALAQVGDKPDPKGPQIEIESKFVEMTEDAANRAGMKWLLGGSGAGVSAVVTRQQSETIFKAIGNVTGVDVLAAPRVMTFPKQRATIQIVREFVYPTEWEKDKPGAWKPKTFETKNVGTMLGVEAAITEDGSLDLEIEPEVVELLGFIDLDAGKKELPPNTVKIPAGHRTQPIFSTRKIKTRVTLWSGTTVVIRNTVREESAGTERREAKKPGVGKTKRHLLVFVTAKIIKPVIAEKSVTITSDSQTFDKATGVLTASGNVRIETPQAVIQADKVVINPKPGAAVAQKAAKIVVPRLEFVEASLSSVVEYLKDASCTLDPEKKGVNIILQTPPGMKPPAITLNLRDIPLLDAVRYTAEIAGLKMTADENALVLSPAKTPAAGAWRLAAPVGAAAAKAKRIMLPRVEFVEASLSSVVEYLKDAGCTLDPEKKGVNIILQTPPGMKPPAITLNLRDIPLLDALNYVAEIGGLSLVADDHALRLVPKKTK